MMDPSIGWYQPEHNGPALELWKNLWNKSNPNVESCSHPNHDVNDGYQYWKSVANTMSSNARNAKNRRENPSSTYDLDNNPQLCRIYSGTPWRQLRDFYDSGLLGLHQEIEDFFDYMKPTPEEREMRKEVLSRVTKVIEDLWPTEAVVDCFGSFRTETYLPTSDIDLVVMGRWDTSPLYQLEKKILDVGICDPSTLRVLDKASIPIIKMTDLLSGIRINISFNLGNVFNSVKLIKDFKEKFPNLPKLVLVIKHFLLQRDLNEVFTGGLSSYALTLMVINFFQMHRNIESNSSNANLGALLLEFFQLYGQFLNYNKVGLRIRDGGSYVAKDVLLKSMDKYKRSAPLLCIEDPLDPTNNVSKNSYEVYKVKNSFDYAYDMLYRAVGPLNSTVDQTKSILGRIIRITDTVIQNRGKYLNNSQQTDQMSRDSGYSSGKALANLNDFRLNRKLLNNSSRNLTPNRYRNNYYRYHNHNQQTVSTGNTSANLTTQFQNHSREYFRNKNQKREDYGQYRHHNHNSHHRQNIDHYSRNFGYPIRKTRSNTFD